MTRYFTGHGVQDPDRRLSFSSIKWMEASWLEGNIVESRLRVEPLGRNALPKENMYSRTHMIMKNEKEK